MRRFAFVFLNFFFMLAVSVSLTWAQGIPQPYRIGGTVTIDGVQITQSTDDGLVIRVTKPDGTDYTDAVGNHPEDEDGLNTSNWYVIDIPIYNAAVQPSGAMSGNTAIINVYLNGKKLIVTNPADGNITVGAEGSDLQIDLIANSFQKWSGTASISLKFTDIYEDAAGNEKFESENLTDTGTLETYLREEDLVPNEDGCYIYFISDDEETTFCITQKASISTDYVKITTSDIVYLKGLGTIWDKEKGTGPLFLDLTKATLKKNKLGELVSISVSGKFGGGFDGVAVFSGSLNATLYKE
jgi:hypothetical protein